MRSFKILVVEDYERFRRFVCSRLQERSEFQVSEASDGLEAIQKAEELQPDLILLDVGLPKLNGIEVARQRALAARILFLSQESSADVIREALSLGAGYVHKPYAQSDLMPAIEAVLEGKRFVSTSLGFSEDTDPQAPHDHEILFCSNDAALLDGLTRFIAGALNAGNPAIVWATQSHRESLVERLREHGVDMDVALQRGTYIASDIAEPPDPVRTVGAIRSLSEAASKMGTKHPRVAVCGERAGRLWADGKTDAAIQLEQLFNELSKNNSRELDMDILCVYPSPYGEEDNPQFKNLCAEHSVISSR